MVVIQYKQRLAHVYKLPFGNLPTSIQRTGQMETGTRQSGPKFH